MTAIQICPDLQSSEGIVDVASSAACNRPSVAQSPKPWPALTASSGLGEIMCNEEALANPLVDAVSNTTAILMASALGFGLVVSGDLRVNEKGAAKLLGYSHEHLKAMRQSGNAPVCYAIGVDGSRLSYRLGDLASWIEAGRENLTRR